MEQEINNDVLIMNGCLFLYSDQVIEANRAVDACLLDFIGKVTPKFAYISSAPDQERYFFTLKKNYYSHIGIELSAYFDENILCDRRSVESLRQFDAIHLSGGNTFEFLSWIRKCNLMNVLKKYVDTGGVLVGTSAGSILMTPSIETAFLCGDKNESGETDCHSIGLTDFYYLPHHDAELDVEALYKLGLDRKRKVLCAADGSGIMVNTDGVRFVGDVTAFSLAENWQHWCPERERT